MKVGNANSTMGQGLEFYQRIDASSQRQSFVQRMVRELTQMMFNNKLRGQTASLKSRNNVGSNA